MAGADYRSCDVCGTKTVYDADLHYADEWDPTWKRPYGVGAWVVICQECAKTHEIVLRKRKAKRDD